MSIRKKVDLCVNINSRISAYENEEDANYGFVTIRTFLSFNGNADGSI